MFAAAALPFAGVFLAPVAFGLALVAVAAPPRAGFAVLLLLDLVDLGWVELVTLVVDVDVLVFVPAVLLAPAALLLRRHPPASVTPAP